MVVLIQIFKSGLALVYCSISLINPLRYEGGLLAYIATHLTTSSPVATDDTWHLVATLVFEVPVQDDFVIVIEKYINVIAWSHTFRPSCQVVVVADFIFQQ